MRFIRLTPVLACLLFPALPALASSSDPANDVRGKVFETTGADQSRAEELFAMSEAAVYFPSLGRVRWMVAGDSIAAQANSTSAGVRALRDFADELERDYPGFRENAHGPWLLKMPMAMEKVERMVRDESIPAEPLATVFTESFENGMSNWTLDNNTLDLYSWGATTCEARTGTRSADALRGGVNTLGCADAYGPNVTTTMTHKTCESIAGASQAWLDAYVHTSTELNNDTLGFYYADSAGQGYGYGFSGSYGAWFHLAFNLKQWYRVGDLTAASCAKLMIQFKSDAQTQSGFGARIDDITIGNSAPSFAGAAITATPSSGTIPLTVNFTSTVSGASAAATYLWSFGDANGTTASTPNTSFTYTAAGDYWVRLRVEDTNIRSYAHTLVRATAAAACSVTCTATAPTTVAAGSSALFQATATATGCSGTPSYSWDFGDMQVSIQQNASHTYNAAGTYSWRLTTAVAGQTCTKSGTIVVTAAGSAKTTRRRVIAPPADSSTLASQTIGPSGGTLTGGGYSLTVPAGAFGGTSTVTLTKSNATRKSGDLSSTFYVQGLPNTLSADLSLSIDLDSTPSIPSGQALYVSFGGFALDRDSQVSSVPFLIPATASGKTIKATIPKGWGSPSLAAKAARTGSATVLGGDPRHESTVVVRGSVSNDHFTVNFYPGDQAWAQSALTTLEEAHQRLVALGFSWGCRQSSGTFVKIPVYVQSLGTGETDPYGEQNSRLDPCGSGWVFTDYIALNKDYPVSSSAMRAAIGHELFHFMQEMYVPTSLTDPSRGLWIAEASSTWFETIFVPGSCPGVMTGDYQFAWKGLFNPGGSAVEGSGRRRIQNHGYGAAALMKYHSDASSVTNDPFVSTIWNSLKAGNGDVDAWQTAIGSSIPDYWTKFAKDYFEGTAGCASYQVFSQKATMTDVASLGQTFKFSAYPMSAISFGFDVKNLAITDKTPLPIAADGLVDGQTVYVYDVKSKSELAQLTKKSNTYTIEDITTLKGSIVILVFVDANLPGASGSNEVTISTAKTYKCFASYSVYSYKEGSSTCTAGAGTGCWPYDGSISSLFVGIVQGDKFKSDTMYCDPLPTYCRWRDFFGGYTASASATLTNKGATMEGFSLTHTGKLQDGSTSTESISVSAAVPLLTSNATTLQYKLIGAGACSSVTLGRAVSNVICNASSYFLLSCETYKP